VVAVTVLVPVTDERGVDHLLHSLDNQSLDSDAFEVLFYPAAWSGAPLPRLQRLVRFRPNFRVLTQDEAAASSTPLIGEGEFVLAVRPDDRLFPTALERLLEFARKHALDAVVGRVVDVRATPPEALWTDAAEIDGAVGLDPALPVLRRRDPAGESGAPSWRTGVLATYATLLRGDSQPPPRTEAARRPCTVASAIWDEGILHVVADFDAEFPTSSTPRAALQLKHLATNETFLLPAETSPAATPRSQPLGDGVIPSAQQIEVRLDPRATPSPGATLAPGVWTLSLLLASDDPAGGPPRPLSWQPCQPALLGSTIVVPAPSGDTAQPGFTLDIGPLQHPLVTGVDPTLAVIRESVVGSELVLPLPKLHVSATTEFEGTIALDRVRLPARIRVRSGQPELVALVSGLKGTPALATQFGPGPMRASGLRLQITGSGSMSLIRAQSPSKPTARPEPAKPKATPSEGTEGKRGKRAMKRKKTRPRQGLAAELRRAVPAPFEPVVKRLASVSVARRLYRRVTR